jgi:Tol biopolymer transport system component
MPRKKRTISAEDLYNFEIIHGCEMSPDGQQIAFVVQRVEKKSEKKYANLWIVPTIGGRPKKFTWGEWVDSSPKWSPDGSQLAFLSNRRDEKQAQIK